MSRLPVRSLVPTAVLLSAACFAGSSHGPSSDDRRPPKRVATSADTIMVESDAYLGPDGEDYWKGTTDSLVVDGVRSIRTLIQVNQAAIAAAVGSGTLASATLELTVQATGATWPAGGATVDAHRVLQHWTEADVTWVCADGHEAWDMSTGAGSIWQTAHTARTTITNGQTGVVQLDVTADVTAFLSGQANRGWLIKRTSEGATEPGRISFSSREGTPEPRLIIEVAANVPESAPDSVPSWVMADSNIVDGSPLISGKFVGRIVVVRFRRGTTLADRVSAIDAVGGTVVGGRSIPGAEGYYFVRVEDPGDASILLQASSRLRAMPQVSHAGLDIIMGLQWLAPRDGPGFDTWQPGATSFSALPNNWWLHMVHAPEAWGCETGSVTAPIAVVDGNLQNRGDLSGNIVLTQGTTFQGPGDGHATAVLSALAAIGDNQVGMTGVMWRAGVRYYDFRRDSTGAHLPPATLVHLVVPMERAARDGARVINVSSAIPWAGQFTGGPGDSTRVAEVALGLSASVAELRLDAVPLPLYVLAAGNDGLQDAYFGGFTALRAGPDSSHFLVVGGVDIQAQRYQTASGSSNQGRLLDVLAPAEDVWLLGSNGSIVSKSGTSFAAPIASGIAGLLLSFDPTLTATQLKELVVSGASNGGLVGTGFTHARPVVNAYQSLKLASQRPGAPLCGNRVWVENGVTVRVERANGDETIGTLPGLATWFATHHGGRIVSFSGQYFRYAGQSWILETGSPPGDATWTGSRLSAQSWTHDRDSIVDPQWGQQVLVGGQVPVALSPYNTAGSSRFIGYVPLTLGLNEKAYVSSSPSPVRDWILVSVSIVGTEVFPEYAKSATIYRLPFLGGSAAQIAVLSDRMVYWIGMSEDGKEFAAATGQGQGSPSVPVFPVPDCEVSFRSVATGVPARAVSTQYACNNSYISGGFAPLRASRSRPAP